MGARHTLAHNNQFADGGQYGVLITNHVATTARYAATQFTGHVLVKGLQLYLHVVTQAADYKKEGNETQARSCGSMAYIYDMVIVVINIGAYIVCIASTAVAVAIIFTRAKDTIDTASDAVHIGHDINNGIHGINNAFTPPF